jgi:DNA adenine methylase
MGAQFSPGIRVAEDDPSRNPHRHSARHPILLPAAPCLRRKVTGQTFGTATTGPAINLLRIEENLSVAWQRLSGTYVENLPWFECAERYDRAHTFHYMDPPYWQTAGYGVDFPFENYERMADFMRRCKGKVMVSINDHPDIRRVFDGFHFETLDIRYSNTNQRQGKAEVSGELVIMNWSPAELGGLF